MRQYRTMFCLFILMLSTVSLARPCSALFKALADELVVPRDEPIDPKDIDDWARRLDTYFDSLITGYPKETQTLVREMYYSGKNVVGKVHLLEDENAYGRWSLRRAPDNSLAWEVEIDPRIRRCPLLYRLVMIHEVAVHIGQGHSRVDEVGVSNFLLEVNSGDFHKLSEMSAAAAEKRAIDAIPLAVLEADIRNNLPPAWAERVFSDYRNRKATDFRGFLRLAHRSTNPDPLQVLTEAEYQYFLRRYRRGQDD